MKSAVNAGKDNFSNLKDSLTTIVSGIKTGLKSLTDNARDLILGRNDEKEINEQKKNETDKFNELNEKFNKVKNAKYSSNPKDETFSEGTFIPTDKSKYFNCIGFVCYMFGLNQKKSVANFNEYREFEEIQNGKEINLNKCKTGDVITWEYISNNNKKEKLYHAMIYDGQGNIWECCEGNKKTPIRNTNYKAYISRMEDPKICNCTITNVKVFRKK